MNQTDIPDAKSAGKNRTCLGLARRDGLLHRPVKQFHNPTSDKTKRIFQEYLGLDVTEGWSWANFEPEKAKTTLNSWIGKRGDAVHRSKPINNGSPVAHLIKRDELEKVIRFIKDLVKATDAYVDSQCGPMK